MEMGGCKIASESGWGLLLARKAGLVTLGKGSVGMKEGKGTVVREGMGKAVRCYGGLLSSSKTSPSQQTPPRSLSTSTPELPQR